MGELIWRKDGGIHGTTKALLGLCQGRSQIGKGGRTNRKQVDVTLGALLRPGNGAVDKGDTQFLEEGTKHAMKNVDKSYRLGQDAAKLGQNGAVLIGGKIDAVSFDPAAQNSCFNQ